MRLLLLLLLSSSIYSQELEQFNRERLDISKKLMITYGSWSIANLATGTIGWATAENQNKYFNQMNMFWGGINLAIAIPSYLRAKNTNAADFNFKESWKAQSKVEKVFLFNSGLDLTYITLGFVLRNKAVPSSANYDRVFAYGNSFILQGSFLFLLDLTAAIIHNNHRKNKLDGFLNQLEMSDNGLGVKLKL